MYGKQMKQHHIKIKTFAASLDIREAISTHL